MVMMMGSVGATLVVGRQVFTGGYCVDSVEFAADVTGDYGAFAVDDGVVADYVAAVVVEAPVSGLLLLAMRRVRLQER